MDQYVFSHLVSLTTLVLIGAFLFLKSKSLRKLVMKKHLSQWEQVGASLFFGAIGILGTHAGIQTTYAIANIRAVPIITAGLVGGPWVGLGAAAIAALYRYYLGGITYLSSAGSTLIEGIIAGYCYYLVNKHKERWPYALVVGFILEALHMLMLLCFTGPYEQAWLIVRAISPAMLLINPLGIAFWIAIIDNIHEEQEKVEGKAARMALRIAGKTLAFLRKGLNEKSASEVADTILASIKSLDAVAITSKNTVLAFAGIGADHHKGIVVTKSTLEALASGSHFLAKSKAEIGCAHPDCLLQSKIVVPLKDQNTVIGALTFYKSTKDSITPFEIELLKGLSQLISIQLELSKLEEQVELRARAEVKALQLQINPHFLFNTLNTIVYYCRSQPDVARNLLINLSDYYRNNLTQTEEFVDFETEIAHINSYIQLEMARFQGKLQVEYVFPEKYCIKVPPLILQPIVENAIKHGLYPKKSGGCITISGHKDSDRLIVTVADNGVGIPADKINSLLEEGQEVKHIGLINVHNRLKAIYGPEFGITITSVEGKGTTVSIPFPA